MQNMQILKNTFIKSAICLFAFSFLMVSLPAMADAAVCSQSTSPLKNLTGLTSVVITEKTGTNNVLTYTPASSSLNFGTGDLDTTAVEHYDFYYSDADGTANTNGSYISSKMHRDVSGANAQSGNNIDSMKLVVGSSVYYADLVASYQLGASVSSVSNAALSQALGAPDGLVSTVGDQDSRITLGFCSAFTTTTTAQCNDNIDNDMDGATDYPSDFSCSSATDNDESNPKSACQDTLDNDGDGLIDWPNDPGCSSRQDNDEINTTTAQCSDNLDNDGDGATDYPSDFSCSSGTDTDETNPKAACQDGTDNDTDGSADYPNDAGCSSRQDNDEFNQTTNPLNVSCIANPSSAQVNQSVNFIANVSGGTGSYNYSWSGACSSSSQTCYNSFTTPGTYNASLYVTSGSQTQSVSCSVNVTQQITSCQNHSYQQCQSNAVYWYNSCGQQQDIFQYCNSNQICSNNTCINQGGQAGLYATKTVRNLTSSGGNSTYSSIISANPLDIVEFKIVVQATGNQSANNVIVMDSLPANLLYSDTLKIDGIANGSNITQQLNLGSLYQGQTKTITYWAQVANAQNFQFGTTTLNNSATVTADGTYSPAVATASVTVNRSGVLGVTTISTGLTNNPWVDNFFLPALILLAIVSLGVWILRKRAAKKFSWIGKK